MSNYKLYYYNLRGRAELSRLILYYSGIPFEDIRLEKSEWPLYKSVMPFGVPVLELDGGRSLAQSTAIARYLAKKYGLAGKNEWEEAMTDMYVDCINDLWAGLISAYSEKDPERQEELYVKFVNQQIVPHVHIVDKQLADNGTGFLVGSELTWADLAYYGFFSFLVEKYGDLFVLKNAPYFEDLIDRVGTILFLRQWIED